MKVCIVLNGEIKDYKRTKEIILNENYDFIIGADGGCNHLYKMNIDPNYIIGDLDSIDKKIIDYYKSKKILFKKYPTHKDETDSQICVLLAKELKASNIDFIGSLGGRIDHTLANIGLIYHAKNMNINSRILSSEEEVLIVKNEEINLKGKRGNTVSIISIEGEAKGVTLENFEYPLNNARIDYLSPLGVSNVMLYDECRIRIDEGCVLVIRNLTE